MPEMSYTLVSTGPTSEQGPPSEAGFINGGMLQREAPFGSPVITVDVEDIDKALAEIGTLGGTTVSTKLAVAAYFKDPEGNLMGLWQNATPAQPR